MLVCTDFHNADPHPPRLIMTARRQLCYIAAVAFDEAMNLRACRSRTGSTSLNYMPLQALGISTAYAV
jgi:hypothetical protein